jgi:hypothetical protein
LIRTKWGDREREKNQLENYVLAQKQDIKSRSRAMNGEKETKVTSTEHYLGPIPIIM